MPTPEFILISLKFKFDNPCIPHNDRIFKIYKKKTFNLLVLMNGQTMVNKYNTLK